MRMYLEATEAAPCHKSLPQLKLESAQQQIRRRYVTEAYCGWKCGSAGRKLRKPLILYKPEDVNSCLSSHHRTHHAHLPCPDISRRSLWQAGVQVDHPSQCNPSHTLDRPTRRCHRGHRHPRSQDRSCWRWHHLWLCRRVLGRRTAGKHQRGRSMA
jgi:hypothetical protein